MKKKKKGGHDYEVTNPPECSTIQGGTTGQLNLAVSDKKKEDAEEQILDDILDECVNDKAAKGTVPCATGTCAGGKDCTLVYTLNPPLPAPTRGLRPDGTKVWVYQFQGTATYKCRCI